jgi:glycosyltransferase involved in cell wall biosynthesis
MDGGSTDQTLEILRSAKTVCWTSERDEGQSHALNKALAASSGKFIGWLNADDAYFTRQAVSTAVKAFEANPDVAVVYGHAALVSSNDRLLHFLWVPRYSRRLLRRYNYIFQPSAFIRRSAIQDFFVDEAYEAWMDRELWLRLAETHRFLRVDRVLAVDRHHAMRKSYRRDLADADRRRLEVDYGSAAAASGGVCASAMRILTRFVGVKLLWDPSTKFNLNIDLDGRSRVIARQITMRRGRVRRQWPLDDPTLNEWGSPNSPAGGNQEPLSNSDREAGSTHEP